MGAVADFDSIHDAGRCFAQARLDDARRTAYVWQPCKARRTSRGMRRETPNIGAHMDAIDTENRDMDTSSSWRASAAALTRRARRCAWILLALCGLGLSLPASARHTQRSAYAACVADAQMNYNSNLAMHGPAWPT